MPIGKSSNLSGRKAACSIYHVKREMGAAVEVLAQKTKGLGQKEESLCMLKGFALSDC